MIPVRFNAFAGLRFRFPSTGEQHQAPNALSFRSVYERLDGVGGAGHSKVGGVIDVRCFDILQAGIPTGLVVPVKGWSRGARTDSDRDAVGLQPGSYSATGLARASKYKNASD